MLFKVAFCWIQKFWGIDTEGFGVKFVKGFSITVVTFELQPILFFTFIK